MIKKLLALGALAAALAAPAHHLAFAEDVAGVDSHTLVALQGIAKDYRKDAPTMKPLKPRLSTAHGGQTFAASYASSDYVVQESYEAVNECRSGLRAGERQGLFIKLEQWGGEWTYATADAKGEITSAGRIASCIRCHETTKEEKP